MSLCWLFDWQLCDADALLRRFLVFLINDYILRGLVRSYIAWFKNPFKRPSVLRPFNLDPDFWKSRSISNPRKISGSANLDFLFQFWHLCLSALWFKPSFLVGWRPGKRIKVFSTWNFSRVWNRPWFSEVRVQIKRPRESLFLYSVILHYFFSDFCPFFRLVC